MSPSPRTAAVLAAVALTALVLPPWLPAVAALAVLGAAIGDAMAARRAPAIDRQLPRVLSRGVPARFSVTSQGPLRARIRQSSPPDVGFYPDEGDGQLQGEVVAWRRGRHHIAGVAVMTEGPLGLGRCFHDTPEGNEVVVYPDLPTARRLALAVRRGRFGAPGRMSRGPLGLGTDFESIRDYLPDDDIRQVNWRATARLGRPMSNQYRIDQDRDVVCLVDTGRLMAAPLSQELTRLDRAIDASVAVALVCDAVGDRAGAIAFDDRIRRSLKPRRKGGQAVVRSLYDLEPTEADSDYELAFQKVGAAKRSLALVLTDLMDEAAARSLLAGVPFLAGTHAVIVAAATDPDVEELATAPPVSLYDAHAARIARTLLEQRVALVQRLRRAGADVVQASPEQLPAACVGAYLRAKRGARL